MKQKITQHTAKAIFFAAVLLATCFSATSAQAQSAFEGKFTLPYEAHWGRAVLPAGDYLLSVATTGNPAMVVIQDARSGRRIATVAAPTRQDSAENESALLIGTRGGQRVIHSLRVAEMGVVFISDPALAHDRRTREEAHTTQDVPVLQAKN